jgi:hypothetical protein
MPFFTCCCSSKTNASAMPWLPEWYFTAVEEGAKEETESDGTGGVKERNRWGQQWMGDQVCVLLWPRPALLWRRRGSTAHCHFPCSALALHVLFTRKGQKHVALHVRSLPSRTKSMWLFTYVRSLQPQGPKACGSSCWAVLQNFDVCIQGLKEQCLLPCLTRG